MAMGRRVYLQISGARLSTAQDEVQGQRADTSQAGLYSLPCSPKAT